MADALIRRAEKESISRTDWAEQIELADQLEGLNPAQLREMVEILLKQDGMPGEIRVRLTIDLLQRLAKDVPQEALALMMELEPRLPEDFYRLHFTEELAGIASRFGEQSPDVAWEWYLGIRAGRPEDFNQIRQGVLGGIAKRDPARALRLADESSGEGAAIYILRHYCTTLDQRVAALKALRTWSGDDAGRKEKLDDFIQKQTMKSHVEGEKVRFKDVMSWIQQAGLTMEELSFLGDRSKVDLSYSIDPRDTGKLIEWLDLTFPEKQSTQQIKRLVQDWRTRDAVKAWLATLPPERATALEKRLAEE
ncbi:MAG: hypothetical protein EOP83_02680 [Verrucomicrobiaceae bacterium]|nr:MAG: hypothetical protein EOP83_02680 [Verrucomicrobiaceae bacterium]